MASRVTVVFLAFAFGFGLFCMVCMRAGVALEDVEDGDMTVTEETEGEEVFVATREWQEVKDGQSIPRGLHVRINLETGMKEAKLMEEEDEEELEGENDSISTSQYVVNEALSEELELQSEEPELQSVGDTRRLHHYGKSDRSGIINKKTKPFTKQEMMRVLKELHEEDNNGMVAGITYSRPVKEGSVGRTDGTGEQAFHQEDGRPPPSSAEVMMGLLQVLVEAKQQEEALMLQALSELEYHLHQFDNARQLNSMGGFGVLVNLLNHSSTELASQAAVAIGAATQSNPEVQDVALDYQVLAGLCSLLDNKQPEAVQKRAVFALGALVRGNSLALRLLLSKQSCGLELLGQTFSERPRTVQLRTLTLLTDLLKEQSQLKKLKQDNYLNELFEVVSKHQLCEHASSFLYLEQPRLIEKGLQAIDAFSSICDFSSHLAQLRSLISLYSREMKTDPGNEFIQSLLHLSQSLVALYHRDEL